MIHHGALIVSTVPYGLSLRAAGDNAAGPATVKNDSLSLVAAPSGLRHPSGVYLHMAWETLTHAGVGSAGLSN